MTTQALHGHWTIVSRFPIHHNVTVWICELYLNSFIQHRIGIFALVSCCLFRCTNHTHSASFVLFRKDSVFLRKLLICFWKLCQSCKFSILMFPMLLNNQLNWEKRRVKLKITVILFTQDQRLPSRCWKLITKCILIWHIWTFRYLPFFLCHLSEEWHVNSG